MTILAAFLAGMSFVIAVAACVAARDERLRAQRCERALSAAIAEHVKMIASVGSQAAVLEDMIRAVAAASVPPVLPVDQSKVYISVPGPRTAQ